VWKSTPLAPPEISYAILYATKPKPCQPMRQLHAMNLDGTTTAVRATPDDRPLFRGTCRASASCCCGTVELRSWKSLASLGPLRGSHCDGSILAETMPCGTKSGRC